MERSSEECPRRMRSEAAGAKMAERTRIRTRSMKSEGSRRRTRSMRSEAAGAKMAEVTRRRTRRMKSEGSRRRTRRMRPEAKMASEEDKGKMASEEDQGNRILKLEWEADRKILMKVKSEEGKILKLKKDYVAASEAELLPTKVSTVKAAQPDGKKAKKVVIKRLMTMTKAQIDFVKAMAAHPCPTRILTEDQLAKEPKSYQDTYRQILDIRNRRLAYFGALADQQEEFGYAVDESEVEVSDNEGDGMVET